MSEVVNLKRRIYELEGINEALVGQIKRMRCCGNCESLQDICWREVDGKMVVRLMNQDQFCEKWRPGTSGE